MERHKPASKWWPTRSRPKETRNPSPLGVAPKLLFWGMPTGEGFFCLKSIQDESVTMGLRISKRGVTLCVWICNGGERVRNKKGDLPPVGEGCKQVHALVGLYHKVDFTYCREHSNMHLNTCVVCGELFHTMRKHTKTCGNKCRMKKSRTKGKKRVVVFNSKGMKSEQEIMW